jgi:hypothetical protein
MLRKVIAFAALLAIAVLAGCGSSGSGGSSDSSTAELSKAEFIKQGDAICAKTDKVQETELQEFQKKDPEGKLTQAVREEMVSDAGLPPIQDEVEELAALQGPSADSDEIEAIVGGIEEALKEAEADPSLLLKGGSGPFTEPGKLAATYGFKECDQAL